MVPAVDWVQLAKDVGSLRDDGETGGTRVAQRALERILGEQNLRGAMELILAGQPGAELALSVLVHLCSEQVAELAYAEYQCCRGERGLCPQAHCPPPIHGVDS